MEDGTLRRARWRTPLVITRKSLKDRGKLHDTNRLSCELVSDGGAGKGQTKKGKEMKENPTRKTYQGK